MSKITVVIIVLGMFCYCQKKESPAGNVIYLKNEKVIVGVLPDLGGRVVVLKAPALRNIFKSDSAQWNEPADQRPNADAFADFREYNGHIMWLGPQSDWWSQQDVNPERRDAQANWPPDPYLIYGSYEITKRTDTSIVMVSPESEVSGVILIKNIQLNPDGTVLFSAISQNIRNTPVFWDLWFNTRLEGKARCYVPLGDENNLRIETAVDTKKDTMAYRLIDGYFTFSPEDPPDKKEIRTAKAYIYPDTGFMAAFSEQQMLIIDFEKFPAETIHPEQALVEIYNRTATDVQLNLLELEYHSAYKQLAPGESMTVSETWHVVPYSGEETPAAQIMFLNDYLGK